MGNIPLDSTFDGSVIKNDACFGSTLYGFPWRVELKCRHRITLFSTLVGMRFTLCTARVPLVSFSGNRNRKLGTGTVVALSLRWNPP